MSEPVDTSSALFGADGTALPDPLPVLADPLTGPERDALPAASTIPPVALPAMPDASAMREAILAQLDADPQAGRAEGGASHQRPLPSPGGHNTGSAQDDPYRPLGSGPARVLNPVPPADLRRRSGRETAAGLQTRAAGSVRTGCVLVLILFAVVVFNILAGFAQSVSDLLP